MPIQDTDLFLVSNSGSKKCEAQNLNGKTGNVLVNRGGVSHKTGIANIPTTVLDDDLMLVNRGGASFKATGAEVQTLFPQGPAGATDVIEAVADTELAGGWNTVDVDSVEWRSITYGNGKYVAVASTGSKPIMYSTDGINWTSVSAPSGNSSSWLQVTYAKDPSNPSLPADGLFVAVANGGTGRAMYSPDGITWTTATIIDDTEFWSVRYGGGKFVAVGHNGSLSHHSTDGINWSPGSTSMPRAVYNGLVYAEDKFIAVGNTANAVISTDGINWELGGAFAPGDPTLIIRAIAYGNGAFVAVAQGGTNRVMQSTDGGATWTQVLVEYYIWNSVTFGAGKFLAVAGSGTNKIMYSSDGLDWKYTQSPANNSHTGVIYGNDKFVAVAFNGGSDRVIWSYTGTGEVGYKSDLTLASDKNLDTFTPGDGLKMVDTNGDTAAYVPITSAITAATPQTLPGGWNGVTVGASEWSSVTYGPDVVNADGSIGFFVAVAQDGTNRLMHSPDGITWTSSDASNTKLGEWTAVTYADGKFVAVGSGGSLLSMYSIDGISWFPGAAINNSWTTVTYGDGKFVAIANTNNSSTGNRVMYSDDGITWSILGVSGVGTENWRSVTYGNGTFVAVAIFGSGRVMYSNDGVAWSNAGVTGAPANAWNSVIYGNGKFVAVGGGGGAMYSADGIIWTAGTPVFGTWQSVTYSNENFVAVGSSGGTVMYSADGISWTSAPAAAAINWVSAAYGDGKFVALSSNGSDRAMWSITGGPDEDVTTLALTPTSKDLKYFNPGDKVTQAANFGTVRTVGTDELILKDTELVGWTQTITPSTANGWHGVAYGKGLFVAVAYNAAASVRSLMTSPDGINWTGIYNSDLQYIGWDALRFANGRFVAVAQEGRNRAAYSDDGINWSTTNSIGSLLYVDLAYGNDRWVATTYGGGSIAYSTDDGSSWATGLAFGSGKGSGYSAVTYGDGKFVGLLGGTNANMQGCSATSTDAITWSGPTSLPVGLQNVQWLSMAYGDGVFVGVGQYSTQATAHFIYSTDGINWFEGSISSNATYNSVIYANNKFIAVGNTNGGSAWSTDGINWTVELTTTTQASDWLDVAYGDGKFAAVSMSNTTIGMYSGTGTKDSIPSNWTTSIGQGAEVDKSLSGAGTYASHTGSVLTVNNSNAEWVDNDNQRGEDFYATTQTTRLSLRKALTVSDYGVMEAKARAYPVAGPWSADSTDKPKRRKRK